MKCSTCCTIQTWIQWVNRNIPQKHPQDHPGHTRSSHVQGLDLILFNFGRSQVRFSPFQVMSARDSSSLPNRREFLIPLSERQANRRIMQTFKSFLLFKALRIHAHNSSEHLTVSWHVYPWLIRSRSTLLFSFLSLCCERTSTPATFPFRHYDSRNETWA